MQKFESVQTMWILIISLVLLGIIALIAGYIRNKRLQQKIEKGELDRMPEVKEADIEFRDVLYTMQDIDVAGWVRSLQLRGIELPDDLKDEVFLIIGERRNGER